MGDCPYRGLGRVKSLVQVDSSKGSFGMKSQDVPAYMFPEKLYCTNCHKIIDVREVESQRKIDQCFLCHSKKPLVASRFIVACKTTGATQAYHTLLLRRLALSFDSKNNILMISDADVNPEIYTMLLQEVDDINHSSVKGLKEELADNFYHPLDRNDTPDYLKSFAHHLHSESKYEENFKVSKSEFHKLVVYNNPVFFVRKRTGGVLKALEGIIEQISETGQLSGPLLNLIGENVSQLAEPTEEFDFSKNLAAISGEDEDILLSKEANIKTTMKNLSYYTQSISINPKEVVF